jgi:hypothetical protein
MDKTTQLKVQKINEIVDPFVDKIQKIEVKSQEDFDEAGKIIVDFKKYEKMVKENKEAITKPLNEALKNVRALFKPVEDKISTSKTILLGKVNEYKREQDRIAREQAAKLEAKIEKGTIKRPETILKNMDKIQHVDMAVSGLSETTRKVVDFDLEAIPQEYLKELLARPKVFEAIGIEIRKDALGNKAQGIEPRIEKGVTVKEEKVVQ